MLSTKGTWICVGQISEFIDFINTIFKIGNPDQIEILLLNKFTFFRFSTNFIFWGYCLADGYYPEYINLICLILIKIYPS